MASPTLSWSPKKIAILLFFSSISFSCLIEAMSSEKLEQPAAAAAPRVDAEMKCGSCPCGNPCSQQFNLPPPPPPPPPPPMVQNCNPPPPPLSPPPPRPPLPPPSPPPPRFIYVTGGDIYQTDPYYWRYHYSYSGSQDRSVGLLVLAAMGVLSVSVMFC